MSTSSRLGVACAGGVVEGAVYEIGALCALEDAIEGLRFDAADVYVGVSAGAVVTSCLANGVTVHDLALGIAGQSTDETLNIQFEHLFRPALAEYARRIGKTPEAIASALWDQLRPPFDWSPMRTLSHFGSLLPAGLFDNEPVRSYLEKCFSVPGRTTDFRELASRLFVVAVELDRGEITVFGEEGSDHVPIPLAVQASTALPGLYCPVEIDGKSYIDGVARRTVHASRALEAGADLLFALNPIIPVDTSHAPRGARSLVDRGLPSVLSQTFRLAIASRMRTGFRSYEYLYPDADIVLIEPQPEDLRRVFTNMFSFSNRSVVCEDAYQTTLATLRKRREEIALKVRRHGYTLRDDVLDDPSPRLYTDEAVERQAALHEAESVLMRLEQVLGRMQSQMAA